MGRPHHSAFLHLVIAAQVFAACATEAEDSDDVALHDEDTGDDDDDDDATEFAADTQPAAGPIGLPVAGLSGYSAPFKLQTGNLQQWLVGKFLEYDPSLSRPFLVGAQTKIVSLLRDAQSRIHIANPLDPNSSSGTCLERDSNSLRARPCSNAAAQVWAFDAAGGGSYGIRSVAAGGGVFRCIRNEGLTVSMTGTNCTLQPWRFYAAP
jgi:hypothetical protein